MTTPVRTYLFAGLIAGLMIFAAAAQADTIEVGQRQWTGAKLQWIQDGKIRFTAGDGGQQAVPIPTVTRLEVDLRDDLNHAEQLRLKGQIAEAVSAYEIAFRTENRNDLGGYIRYRLMDLYDRTGQLDRGVEMFLDLVKLPDFYTVASSWRPQNLAAVRPKIRQAALVELDDGLRQIRTGLASESVRELRDYIQASKPTAAGGAEPSSQSSGAPSKLSNPSAGTSQAADAPEASPSDAAEPWPGQQALQAGRYGQALQAANLVLSQPDAPRERLAEALYVRGVSQWHVAKDPARVLEAGWTLARLIIEFPGNPHVAECQYYLGLVHQRVGQIAQARALLQQAQASPAASADLKDKARKALLDMGAPR